MHKVRTGDTSGSKVMLIFGIVWLLFSLIFLPIGWRSVQEHRRLDAEGITVSASVMAKRVSERRERDRETKREKVITTHYLTYVFTTDRGKRVEKESSVSKERWEKTKEQDGIEVQYLPTDVTKSRIVGESGGMGAMVMTGLAAVGVLMGLYLVGAYFWRSLRGSEGRTLSR